MKANSEANRPAHAPGFHIPRGVIACPFCASTRFRRSRLHTPDLLELLMLRLPVRCMRCGQRRYVTLLTAGLAAPYEEHGSRISQGNETWQAWTSHDAPAGYRPLTTAVETNATKFHAHDEAQDATNADASQ